MGFDLNYQFKLPSSWENLIPSNEIESICASFDKYLVSNTAESFEIDIPFIRKNKLSIPLHCRAITVNDKSYLLGLVQMQVKIKDRRTDRITSFPFIAKSESRALNQISDNSNQDYYNDKEYASKYESLIIAGNLGGWEYRVNTGALWCSKEYFELLGYDTSMIQSWEKYDVQQVWIDLIHPDDVAIARAYFGQYLKSLKGVYHQNFRMKHADGSWVWISSKGKVMEEIIDGVKSALVIGTHTDITESKQLEEQLHKSNMLMQKDIALFQSIINSPEDIFIVSIDTEYRYTAFSPKYKSFVKEKFGKDIHIGYRVLDIFSEAQLAVFKPALDAALRGENNQLTVGIPTNSSQITYVENHYNTIQYSNGNVIGATVFIHDITAEKNAEMSNKINDLRCRSLFNSTNDAIFIANVNTGIIVDVNQNACELMGYEKQELIGMHQAELHPTDVIVDIKKKFLDLTKLNEFKSTESFIKTKSNKRIPVLITAASAFQFDNEIFQVAYFKDLTDSRAAIANTSNLLELLKTAEMISTTGIIENDLVNNKIIWSDEFFKILGYEPQSFELDKDSLYNHIHSDDRDKFVLWQEMAMKLIGQSETVELRILKNDGTISSIRTSGNSFADESGNVTKFIAVAKDITISKKASEELLKQNNQLKEIAWTQSHIVRAPLTRLMGLVYAMQRGIVPESEKGIYFNYMVDSANELDNVIKEITAKTVSN